MKNFKKILFFFGIFFCIHIKTEEKFDAFEQKIKGLEALVLSLMQNITLQQEQIQLLQKQLNVNQAFEEHDNDILE